MSKTLPRAVLQTLAIRSNDIRGRYLRSDQFILDVLESQPLLSTTQSSERAVFTVTSTCWAGSPTRRPMADQFPSIPYLYMHKQFLC